jgi:peptide-methionine (R)-S-oxide reductase
MKLSLPKSSFASFVPFVVLIGLLFSIPLCLLIYSLAIPNKPTLPNNPSMADKPQHSADDLRARLTPEQFYVTQQKGTEAPFTGKYNDHHEAGMYRCVVCGAELFTSESKFDSHCGWPSFDKSVANKVDTQVDTSHGMVREEITCQKCGAHLGHVFPDGPTATGLRYCVNSASLDFEAKTDSEKK